MPEERTSFKPTRRPPPSPRATIQQAVPEDEEQKEAASDVRPAGDPYEETTRRPAQRVRLSKAARLLGSARGARAPDSRRPSREPNPDAERRSPPGSPFSRRRTRAPAAPFPGGAAETQRRRRYDATFLKRRAKAVAPSFLSTKHDDDELRYSLSNCPALDARVRRAEMPRTSRVYAAAGGDSADPVARRPPRPTTRIVRGDEERDAAVRSVETGPAGTGTRSRWTGV